MPHLLKVTADQRAVPGRTSNSWGCSAASGSKGFSLHSTLRSGFSWYGNRIGVERQMSWLRITRDTKDVLDPHLLSELSINRSSSSQKCSGIPSDSISAKLSPSTWPTQGWVTDFWVSLQDGNNCVQVTCRKWCTREGKGPSTTWNLSYNRHNLQLLWRISLRSTRQSFVFVYQLCGVFCTLWASRSFRSAGKTSAVVAICWRGQERNSCSSNMSTEKVNQHFAPVFSLSLVFKNQLFTWFNLYNRETWPSHEEFLWLQLHWGSQSAFNIQGHISLEGFLDFKLRSKTDL